MKKSFAASILAMNSTRFEKLKNDLITFAGTYSNSALVAWAASQIDCRKNPNGLTPNEILGEINKIRVK